MFSGLQGKLGGIRISGIFRILENTHLFCIHLLKHSSCNDLPSVVSIIPDITSTDILTLLAELSTSVDSVTTQTVQNE